MFDTQGRYTLRKTENYFDLIEGNAYHSQLITFHEFLSTTDALFIYEDTFMQIPGYIQKDARINKIEELARKFVVDYISDEFEHSLIGMQNYSRWAVLFRHKCEAIAPSFWAQVNMHDLMMAYELETDNNTYSRTNTGNTIRIGGQTTKAEQSGNSKTIGKTTTDQDIDNNQITDSSTREGVATVVHAIDQLTDDLNYN